MQKDKENNRWHTKFAKMQVCCMQLKCLPAGSWDMTFEILGAGVLLKGQDIKKNNSATLVHTVLHTLVHTYVGLYFGA